MMSASRELRELAGRALADPLKRVDNRPIPALWMRSQGHLWAILCSVNL